jgi:hypothetical protein
MALEELKPLVQATIGGVKMIFLSIPGRQLDFYPAFFKAREKRSSKPRRGERSASAAPAVQKRFSIFCERPRDDHWRENRAAS